MITSLKILSGTLPTNLNRTRGRRNPEEKRCRNCPAKAETDIHVLQSCPFNRAIVSKRHNAVCDKIAKELKRAHSDDTVQREKTWLVGTVAYRPDISVCRGKKVTLVEVTIPYEISQEHLNQREREKEEKYRILANTIKAEDGRFDEVSVIGVAIGAAGTVTRQTHEKLKFLGIASHSKALQMITLHYSSVIWRNHVYRGGGRQTFEWAENKR